MPSIDKNLWDEKQLEVVRKIEKKIMYYMEKLDDS